MTREMLQEKSLSDLREIAKLQGVKALTKYRKSELVEIIMNGGKLAADGTAGEAAAPKEEQAPAPEVEASPLYRAFLSAAALLPAKQL